MRYPIASLSLLISSSLGLVVCPSLALANEVAAANYSANTNTNIETITALSYTHLTLPTNKN